MKTAEQPAASTWALAYAQMATLSALDTVGRRLTRTLPRNARHVGSTVRKLDTWQRHTVIPARDLDLDQLLSNVFLLVERTAHGHAACVATAVDTYVRTVVQAGKPYDPSELARVVDAAGCLEETADAA